MNHPLNYLVVPASLLSALMLAMLPLPSWSQAFRPDWIALVAIYWALALPRHFGVIYAWCFGLLLDVAQGALLGQHALGISIIIYLCLRFHQRMRLFPLGQQAVVVMLLLTLKQSLVLWVYGITGRAPENIWLYYLPALIGGLLWPWLFILLRDLRRKFKLR